VLTFIRFLALSPLPAKLALFYDISHKIKQIYKKAAPKDGNTLNITHQTLRAAHNITPHIVL